MFRLGSRRESRAWREGRMSKRWAGGRGGCDGGVVAVVVGSDCVDGAVIWLGCVAVWVGCVKDTFVAGGDVEVEADIVFYDRTFACSSGSSDSSCEQRKEMSLVYRCDCMNVKSCGSSRAGSGSEAWTRRLPRIVIPPFLYTEV